MKVIMINGSPRIGGNCSFALSQARQIFEREGVEVKLYELGGKDIRGCIACSSCRKSGKCVFDDLVNQIAEDFKDADGMMVASPVYFASANGSVLSLLQRLFYSTPYSKKFKVGAGIAVARRAGTVSTFEQINRFFSISEMPIVTSNYWNDVFGREKGEAKEDKEGIAVMHNLARNMVYLMRAIAEEKKRSELPKTEREMTNFIR